jgi:hypothetical protein
MKWVKVQKSVREYTERGTERKLEKYPQGVEKRNERGGIGGDKWRGGRASKKSLPRHKNEDREVDHILRIFWTCEVVTTSTTV